MSLDIVPDLKVKYSSYQTVYQKNVIILSEMNKKRRKEIKTRDIIRRESEKASLFWSGEKVVKLFLILCFSVGIEG